MRKITFVLFVLALFLIAGCQQQQPETRPTQTQITPIEKPSVTVIEPTYQIDKSITDVLAKASSIDSFAYTKKVQKNELAEEIEIVAAYDSKLGEKQAYANREFHKLQDGKVYEFLSRYLGDTNVLVPASSDYLKPYSLLHEFDTMNSAKVVTKKKLIGTWEIMAINFTTTDGSTGTSDIILARGVPLSIEKTDSSGNKIKITYEGLKMGITIDDLKPPRGNWEVYNETA